jgi:hypothetical protein
LDVEARSKYKESLLECFHSLNENKAAGISGYTAYFKTGTERRIFVVSPVP